MTKTSVRACLDQSGRSNWEPSSIASSFMASLMTGSAFLYLLQPIIGEQRFRLTAVGVTALAVPGEAKASVTLRPSLRETVVASLEFT